jgi:hypothetical protein
VMWSSASLAPALPGRSMAATTPADTTSISSRHIPPIPTRTSFAVSLSRTH